jgi:hypothetical protein
MKLLAGIPVLKLMFGALSRILVETATASSFITLAPCNFQEFALAIEFDCNNCQFFLPGCLINWIHP